MNLAPVARIVTRYLVGALVFKGLIDAGLGAQLSGDADVIGLVQAGIGVAVGLATEGCYILAKKFGWRT